MIEKITSTTETQVPEVKDVDLTTLTQLVQIALKRETVEVIDWEFEQLNMGAGEWSAVYRLSGKGRDKGKKISWSLILKTLQPHDLDCELTSWNYCKREVDAYQSGWLDDLPGGLAAPRNFGTIEYPDGTCWIWLEDVKDAIGKNWPLEHYGVVARHVGQFNGAYLCGKQLSDFPWLSSGWLRNYVDQSAASIEPIRRMIDYPEETPLIRHWFPGKSGDKFFALWENRNFFLDILDHLPQTVCHLDVFRRNLFAGKTPEGDDQTIAVDWAFSGRGAVGEEIVPLVLASIGFFEVDLAEANELEEIIFNSYLAGLDDAGWQGDPRQVRLGYSAASLRYRFASIWLGVEIVQDESLQGWWEQSLGYPIQQVFDSWAQLGYLIDNLTNEACELMDELGLVLEATR